MTSGVPLSNATVDIVIGGPVTVTLTSGPSDAEGIAEATWQTQRLQSGLHHPPPFALTG